MNLENFKRWLNIQGFSDKTRTEYYNAVERFSRFSENRINKELIEDYVINLRENGKGQTAVNLFLCSIKKYLISQNSNIEIPKTKTIKRHTNMKPFFTEEQFTKIIQNITRIFPEDYREREFTLYLMFYTGMRPEELLNFKKEHINFDNKEIRIIGKGDKDRYIPFLNNKLVEMLKTRSNISETLVNYSYRQLTYMFRKIKKYFKLDGDIQPRTMRRSFGKYCLAQGMDVLYVKQLMGHEDIETTEIYAEPDKKMIHDKCREIRERSN